MSIELEISKHLPDTCNKWFESRIQNKKAGMTTSHSCFFGPSGETRTRGILVPNQAPYQLGHTRIMCFTHFEIIVYISFCEKAIEILR